MHRSKFEYLKQVRYELLECQGVYGTDSFPRGAQAYLQVAVTPHSSKGSVAIALLNFRDREALARTISGNYWICSQRQIDAKACLPTELGKFHVSATPSLPILNEISSWGQDPLEPSPAASVAASPSAIPSPTAAAVPLVEKMVKRQTRTPNRLMYRYSVNNTGLYCALVGSTQSEPGADYDMKFTAANPYGLLPALFYPALPVYQSLPSFSHTYL